MRLVAATANPDKLEEIAAILAAAGVELLPRPPEVPDVVEDAPTLEGNARLKARAIAEATGLAAVADDTGLEVDALDGAPGVRSARYAGEAASYEDNVRRLLTELSARGAEDPASRGARFRTVALVAYPDGSETHAVGVVDGIISDRPRGGAGFGYDPVFVPARHEGGDGRTFAEMSAEDKHTLSHRGRALRVLAQRLSETAPGS
jgi:XTP/dITP diphosphohydrolase